MAALQFAIGSLNDLVDAPADRSHVPPKPIPTGLITLWEAWAVMVVAALIGVGLAAPSGLAVVGLAVIVLAIGGAYDLVAKGTPWSWVPFAVGIPILPVYGWFAATGELPAAFSALLPMAALAGAGLAIANARADLDADLVAGTRSVATELGPKWSLWANAALVLVATAIGYAAVDPERLVSVPWWLVALGTFAAIIAVGQGRNTDRATLRGAWQLQAIGVAIAGLGWAAALLP
jgi:4-hydroxybenzoate polyprenyltransferase